MRARNPPIRLADELPRHPESQLQKKRSHAAPGESAKADFPLLLPQLQSPATRGPASTRALQ